MRTETSTVYAMQKLHPPKSESQKSLAASVLLRVAFPTVFWVLALYSDFTAKAAAQDPRLSISTDQKRGPSSPKIL